MVFSGPKTAAWEKPGLMEVQQGFIGSMHNSRPAKQPCEIAMRALRFGPVFALSASAALGGCTAQGATYGHTLAAAQADLLTREFDQQLKYTLTEMIASAEIDPEGKVFFSHPIGDRRFLEPDSGRYWQISGEGQEDFRSRSLWDRALQIKGGKAWAEPLHYNSDQFAEEPLRVAERTVRLPGSDVDWQFAVARSRDTRK
jgi:hypothetical protein